jgi:glutamate synthase domain-containing protein 3
MVVLDQLVEDDVELLRRLIREHEEKTVSARARNILVRWDEFLPLFRKVTPKDAALQVAATRQAYLQSSHIETEPNLERRTA